MMPSLALTMRKWLHRLQLQRFPSVDDPDPGLVNETEEDRDLETGDEALARQNVEDPAHVPGTEEAVEETGTEIVIEEGIEIVTVTDIETETEKINDPASPREVETRSLSMKPTKSELNWACHHSSNERRNKSAR